MNRWEQLIAAREGQRWSQEEAAERLEVDVATYRRWEAARCKPRPQHLRTLCELFDPQLASSAQEVWPKPARIEKTAETHAVDDESRLSALLVSADGHEPTALLATYLTAHLWSLALSVHATAEEKRALIRRAIEECDSLHAGHAHYQVTRREAVATLATLPLVTFGLTLPGKEVASARYRELLAHSVASLEACWELYTHGEAGDLLLGFQCTSRYQDVLARIGRISVRHREEAVRLATQCALLKTVFGWHCAGAAPTIQYARQALALSQETGDLPLQLSAYTKLAWTFAYEKNDRQALATAQEAQETLERFEGQMGGAVPPGLRGGVYSTLAVAQARNGLAPDDALAMSMQHDPGAEVQAYLDFTRATMFLNAGWVYYARGDHAQTMQMLEKCLDPETCAPRLPEVTTVGQVETIHLMALSSLQARDRDLERTIHFWQAAAEGATRVCSAYHFALASTIYEHMTVIWPGEARVRALRDHLVQWEKELERRQCVPREQKRLC